MAPLIELSTFSVVSTTDLRFPPEFLQTLPCGLHRAPLDRAAELLPELVSLYDSAPVDDPSEYEIDVKIHMLMPREYPCIPNWHCDNVPRDGGKLRYDLAEPEPSMLVWISGDPQTEFLADGLSVSTPADHGALGSLVSGLDTKLIPPQTWCRFDRLTPHRGRQADRNCWRVFARITPKSIAPARPVISQVRRHAQVYLPSDFHW